MKRLFIVSLIAFFPLGIIGRAGERASLRRAVDYYYLSIFILIIFLFFLAVFTYSRGGNFIKATGTFY